ncbi:phage tail assembly chaperone [Asticcacaulis sp. ZE23SCel15]|uniref:phage tail assembly chaperone n=1 Tax=Asticcacaulis sp. ZE23SCel15 TaxID=3059027 RepID=UPI00265F840E|nr:phage tail assembly chaperone [Asticcacaulis sp. ZE23SCel15]WKL57715.1 phage tail assembly chaperone [Asticcacaulis sp. ZE23SCel15]
MNIGWEQRLRQAVVEIGLTPADFWALSLNEWIALIIPPAAPVLPRDDLNTLMTLFPDDKK